AQTVANQIAGGPKRKHRKRHGSGDEAPAETGERPRDAEAEQRAGQQTHSVPESLPDARIAEHGMEQPADPSVEGLEIEHLRSAFEPVTLHDDAIAESLVHPVVVAGRINPEATDRWNAAHQYEREPRDANQRARAADVAQPRRHRHEHGGSERGNR